MSAVGFNLDRLEPGRTALEFDTTLVREDQVLQGQRIAGFQAAVRGSLDIDSMDQKVVVHGVFSATRELLCDRTGQAFDMEYPARIEVTILRRMGRDAILDPEAGEDDNWVIHQSGGVVDLSEALLEAVVLDEPHHVVHPDHINPVSISVDEQGIHEPDDEAQAIDPRWAALEKLRDGDDQEDSGPVRN